MGGKSQSEERFWKFREPAAGSQDIPQPPYATGNVRMTFVGVRYDAASARQLLPPDLKPAETSTGTIVVYTVGSGWGVAPFSACYASVEVQGFDAPDGSPGYYIAAGYYSDRGAAMMRRHYNLNAELGGGRFASEGDVLVGIGGPNDLDAITTRIKPHVAQQSTAIRHYLGQRPQGGGSCLFPIAFSGLVATADPLSVEIGEGAGARWQLARPVELLYAVNIPEGTLSFGTPRPISDPPAEHASGVANAVVLGAFARIGRAAILVGTGGRISQMNQAAEALIGNGVLVREGLLRTTKLSAQRDLDRLVDLALGDSAELDLDPVALERDDGGPLVVQAIPIGTAITGDAAALVLVNDPSRVAPGDAGPTLQLLGLTQAEAQIAELVGSGISPRDAGERVGNTENTVRSSLKTIYSKLRINRQAELARIVARL